MSQNKLYMVCGVPASGKTWVCEQLGESVEYVSHDNYIKLDANYVGALCSAIEFGDVVTECPFGETRMRNRLIGVGLDVVPVFVVENLYVLRKRTRARTGNTLLPKNVKSRAMSIRDRAIEWGCFHGTSAQVLEHLKGEVSRGDNSTD